MIIPYPFFHGYGLVRATRWVDSCLCFVFRGNYRKKMEFWYVQCSHGQIAFYSYFLGQTALYLWKVICGKKKRRLHSYTYGCFLVSGAEVHTMHFLFVFKLLFEKRGGEIFGHHYFPSGDQKFILDRQLASVFKKLISDPGILICYLPVLLIKANVWFRFACWWPLRVTMHASCSICHTQTLFWKNKRISLLSDHNFYLVSSPRI